MSSITNYILEGIEDYLNTMKQPLIFIFWLLHLFISLLHFFSSSLYQVTRPIIARLHDALFVEFIRILYLKGPNFHGYGFWQGKELADICSSLTNIPAHHWYTNEKENNVTSQCTKRIETNIESIVVGIELIVD